jgi:hypothetical protein
MFFCDSSLASSSTIANFSARESVDRSAGDDTFLADLENEKRKFRRYGPDPDDATALLVIDKRSRPAESYACQIGAETIPELRSFCEHWIGFIGFGEKKGPISYSPATNCSPTSINTPITEDPVQSGAPLFSILIHSPSSSAIREKASTLTQLNLNRVQRQNRAATVSRSSEEFLMRSVSKRKTEPRG